MIYLFANTGYGHPFLRVAHAFSRTQGIPITLVASGRPPGTGCHRSGRRLRAWLSRWMQACSLSRRYGLRAIAIEDVNRGLFASTLGQDDHGIIAGFNQIFTSTTVRRFGSLVNFHPSLLPLYRGPVPSYWCIRNGESHSGYTLHEVTARIDRGPVLAQGVVPIRRSQDEHALDRAIARAAAPCLERYLEHLTRNTEFRTNHVDARTIYRTQIDYLSFPS